jgi:hypothetical protein
VPAVPTVRPPGRTRSYHPAVPNDPLENMETAAEFMAAELDEVSDDLSHAGREIMDILRRDIISRDGYLIVLIMVLLTVVMIAVDDAYTGGQVVSAVMLALLVLTTLSRSHVSHTLRVFGGVVTGTAVIVSIAAALTGHAPGTAVTGSAQWIFGIGACLYTILLALLFPAVLRQAFSHRRVNLNTMAASLAAYLLLGLIFASAYRVVQIVSPPMFSQPDTNGFTYVYFSYVTLTTIGYGDFTAHNDGGRAIAILEGLFGQVFLVTIVALVVSNLGRDRQVLRQLPADPDIGTVAVAEGPSSAAGGAGGAEDGQ